MARKWRFGLWTGVLHSMRVEETVESAWVTCREDGGAWEVWRRGEVVDGWTE